MQGGCSSCLRSSLSSIRIPSLKLGWAPVLLNQLGFSGWGFWELQSLRAARPQHGEALLSFPKEYFFPSQEYYCFVVKNGPVLFSSPPPQKILQTGPLKPQLQRILVGYPSNPHPKLAGNAISLSCRAKLYLLISACPRLRKAQEPGEFGAVVHWQPVISVFPSFVH